MYTGETKDIERNPKFKFYPRENKVVFEDEKQSKEEKEETKVNVVKKNLSKK